MSIHVHTAIGSVAAGGGQRLSADASLLISLSDASLHICTHFTKYLLFVPDTLYQPPRSSLSASTQNIKAAAVGLAALLSLVQSSSSSCLLPGLLPLTATFCSPSSTRTSFRAWIGTLSPQRWLPRAILSLTRAAGMPFVFPSSVLRITSQLLYAVSLQLHVY
ncbi:hypothetical protein, variant [Pseudogymnoascus destructans 20631-21]|uniref:Uncharacterized protein n=1 Tax=Pseudogymnoascus destructans (strain ATCC MYA-4855 / 20631-21) TaxID=658429 RepID=L8FW95_PSED2|nr:hypothetical protein, variant [Pseudogymnoascus destructans 20631-21]